MDEFHFIQKYFSSLSKKFPGALNLSDDVYVNHKKKIAISVDTFVEGIHFPNNSMPSNFLTKIIGASFSDLYCKGVKPLNYFLSIAAPPKKINKHWYYWCAWKDLNPQPPDPKSGALSN